MLISYQRMPATPPDETVWLPDERLVAVAEAAVGETEHAAVADRHPAATSFRACGTQLRVVGQITVYPAGVRFPASVKVELAGVPKSTW